MKTRGLHTTELCGTLSYNSLVTSHHQRHNNICYSTHSYPLEKPFILKRCWIPFRGKGTAPECSCETLYKLSIRFQWRESHLSSSISALWKSGNQSFTAASEPLEAFLGLKLSSPCSTSSWWEQAGEKHSRPDCLMYDGRYHLYRPYDLEEVRYIWEVFCRDRLWIGWPWENPCGSVVVSALALQTRDAEFDSRLG